MAVPDAERREVAALLRAGGGSPGRSPTERVNGALEASGLMSRYVLATDLLADLIDRPECSDVSDTEGVFECYACACEVDVFPPGAGGATIWVGGREAVPGYCPNCGAMIARARN